jgi:hypothetical protein
MSFFEKMKLARENKDHIAFGELLSDGYKFVRHQTGTTMNKQETLAMIEGFFNSDAFNVESHRCVYENDDILVEHMVIAFPDNTKEAVLAAYTKEAGMLVQCETGATKIE